MYGEVEAHSVVLGHLEGGEKMLYRYLARSLVFAFSRRDPEVAHERAMALLELFDAAPGLPGFIERIARVDHPRLAQRIRGLRVPNPVGLGAGFDKNARAPNALEALGFGFIELGTVTQYEQRGNPRPRIFRFPKDDALINRMGFNNDGADKVATRLRKTPGGKVPWGISIGKSGVTPLEKAVDDHLYSLRRLYPYGDYFVVNVSSPNTPGLRSLQGKDQLDRLIAGLTAERRVLPPPEKPLFLKIAPDLTFEALDDVVEVCLARGIDGLIATNTTIGREGLSVPTTVQGGLSGKPLQARAREVVRHLYQHLHGELPIIGVGGIFSAEDAYAMIRAGASAVQIYTGLIYRGPFLPRQINRGLLRLLDRDGLSYISRAVGVDVH